MSQALVYGVSVAITALIQLSGVLGRCSGLRGATANIEVSRVLLRIGRILDCIMGHGGHDKVLLKDPSLVGLPEILTCTTAYRMLVCDHEAQQRYRAPCLTP